MNSDNKASNASNIILILMAMVLGVLIGLMFASHPADDSDGHTMMRERVSEVLDLVERHYVDSVDADSLSERLLGVMLSELDPHSLYLTARETERTSEVMRGNFEGVGLVLHREGDTTYIGRVMADGPSVGSGLLPGDMIWAVDGRRVSGVGMKADSVVSLLRGPRRSTVTIEVKRREKGVWKDVKREVRRGTVFYNTLAYSGMLDDTTGYIRLSSFSTSSHEEFHQALLKLRAAGLRHLILDLRGNTGGALDAAVGIANELLPAGSLIVYTQGAHQRRNDVKARRGGLFTEGQVTVMVDEESASASEVVSGALQDNDRALIVGRRTFGKGLVQREYELSGGASVLLTVARYYTPSGRSIQRPYSEGTDEYYRDYLNQLIEESYADNPTLHVTDSTPYYTVGGRTVYGGGGIFPDRLIAYHKDSTMVYYNRLSAKGLVNRLAFALVKEHAAEWLGRYSDAGSFCRNFHVGDEALQRLVSMGEREGIPLDRRGLEAQHKLFATMLKAYVGDFLFGEEAFYPVYLQVDEDLKELRIKNL